ASDNLHYDISKPEARLYIYYLCTRYIDCGCENIHFGDLFDTVQFDPGNAWLWQLTQAIRNYASKHARRGMVLLDTHAGYDSGKRDPYASNYLYGWFFDDPKRLPARKDDWERQLIFDFHSLGLYPVHNPHTIHPCSDPNPHSAPEGTSVLPVILNYGDGLLNHSKGGLNPQGWYCTHNPVLNRFDYGGCDYFSGCHFTPAKYFPDFYGYDNASWFAHQLKDTRQYILIYLYYKIKCLDSNSHL